MSTTNPTMFGTLMMLYSDGKLLMVKKPERGKDPNSGFYTPPGGKLEDVEKGKNPRGRLERAIIETQQETGITPLDPILRGIILFNNYERNFARWPNAPDYMVYIYVATKYSGTSLEKGDSGEIPCWITEENLLTLPKNPGDARMYEWLDNGRNFIGVIKHKGEKLDEEGTFVDYF